MAALKDKVALVTGANSGIGMATALAFASAGAHVVASDIHDSKEKALLKAIRERGSDGLFIKADVSVPDDAAGLVDKTIRKFGRLDCAFNNAGIEGDMAVTSRCTEENWNRVLAVNLTGVWLCMKHQITVMLEQGRGSIINCSSVAGLVGFQGLPAYVAAKHGVVGLTRSAALECADKGVRVNAVCPGVIRTPMVERVITAKPEMQQMLEAGEPVGRLGSPDEIAAAVLWLADDSASFVTGHALAVDGGWVAQ